jgi:hypothetical protein
MSEGYKPLIINRAIRKLKIYSFSEYYWHYRYHWKGKLEILKIPDNTELTIRAYTKDCMCGWMIKYYALRKDGILYNID